jgi:hypothetical protein
MSELLKPDRKGTWLSLAVGVVFVAIGLVMWSVAGIVVILIGAVGLYGFVGGLWPGIGLRLDEQGFRVKSFGKSWGAEWLECERFEPATVQVGRKNGNADVVRIHYVGGTHEPRHKLGQTLGIDERYVIAAYGGLSNTELARKMEEYRAGKTA